ncbi:MULTISPECIES: hypothetical protein [unclassified Streptomyces]|uniref:hypothetical protein n=1 Tax=unclassified Streptomyces TaxID=2593676 RepID=UPI00099D0645|nr:MULTISPECIES: hypothetical protein [unclassified Streptomyces]MCH0557762.1 hypothetical protein [Streptomyces sp. MUM 16J]
MPRTTAGALRAGVSVAVLAVSGALLLTACSSSPGSASASDKPSGSATASSGRAGGPQAMEAYRQCLSQHGVDLPTFARRSPGAPRPSGSPRARGGFGGGGFPGFGGASPDATTQKALDACKSLRPQFTGRGGAGGANSTAFRAFTSCLKDHGVVVPPPSPGTTNGAGRRGRLGGLRDLNTSDPKTAKAYETCKALLPQRPSGSGTPSPTVTA